MPEQDRRHIVVLDPVQADLRVDLRSVMCSEESVAVEASGRHEYKDPEGRVGKAKALWLWLREQTDGEVDLVNVVVINVSHLLHPDRVVGQLLEGPGRGEAE